MDKQVHIYSVDTSDFYMDKEIRIQKLLNRIYYARSKIRNNNKNYPERLSTLNKRIKFLKALLQDEFKNNSGLVRVLREECITPTKIISVFDSILTRTLNMKINELNDEILIVQTYYFEVFKELVRNGFIFRGEKYICFTASAGQIRTKKTIFIKESCYQEHKNSIMCGLTPDRINSLDGVNINKYLAYLALCNSATDEWSFDIDRSIVVEDMELLLHATVDHIDEETFEITRCSKEITINHTDGCGMILPQLSKKNFMIRMPWIKGLLAVFPFDKFIKEHKIHSCKVKDIYGQEHDIVKDKIYIIFTKSQFKMWKYYSSWDEYKTLFKLHQCKSGICNKEENELEDKRINYQMLQSLVDITDAELKQITERTNGRIALLSHDRNTMLSVFGVKKDRPNMNSLQKALSLYPELLKDEHTKHTIHQLKRKLVKEGKAGKLDIDSKYAFVCPDLYAFCEYLFLNQTEPQGLLSNGEVFFSEYKDGQELDCLRSPHLYMEHAVRMNTVNKNLSSWFKTKGIYTSIHDPISKILMFDNDGDKLLVVSDETLVSVAKRNIAKYDVVPLHYNMRKADNHQITPHMIYTGLITAYTGGNIGVISNDISKIWNHENINLDAIKRLCVINNFVIDYAKTLYKPEMPAKYKQVISEYTRHKVPYFFIYAKQKLKGDVAATNSSTMNRITKLIINKRLIIKNINVSDFDYKMLMSDPSLLDYNKEIAHLYTHLDRENAYQGVNSIHKKHTADAALEYQAIRKEMENTFLGDSFTINDIVDHLIVFLFVEKKSKYKTTFWSSFGDVVVSHLTNNLDTKGLLNSVPCEYCGQRIQKTSNRSKYCSECTKKVQKEKTKLRVKNFRNRKCVTL